MQIFLFSALFLIHFCTIHANSNIEKEGELLIHSALFKKAAKCYETLLKTSEDSKKKSEWRQKLAFCFYSDEQFDAIPSLLEDSGFLTDQERLYLGSAYNQLKRYNDAISILTPSQDKQLDPEINFERGIAYFHSQRYDDANVAFENVVQNSNKLAPLALIYLIKAAIEQNAYDKAQALLNRSSIATDNPLIHERNFLEGIVAFKTQNRALAQSSFEKCTVNNAPWARDASMLLGKLYLDSAEDPANPSESRQEYFNKAINAFSKANELSRTDESLLALGNAYISKGRHLQDKEALASASSLLQDGNLFSGREGQNQAVFLSAQAAESFEERDNLFRRLTQEMNGGSPQYGTWWLHRGINDLTESQRVASPLKDTLVKRALNAFEHAEKTLNSEASIWKGRAHLLENTQSGPKKAQRLFAKLLKQPESLEDPAELYYLYAQALLKNQEAELEDVEWLKEGLKSYPSDEGIFLLAIIHYKKEEWKEAKALFDKVIHGNNHDLKAEALFWAGKSTKADEKKSKLYFKQLYEEYPLNKYSAEAYFSLYSYHEYLQGNRQAMKHLQQLPTLFPNSPYLLNAYYLVGLDFKRDRKSNEGKKVHPKDLNAAIDAFHQVEEHFEALNQKGLIPPDQYDYAVRLYYYAKLERALANLQIADQSEGAKRDIFLEYAQELLAKMSEDFSIKDHPLAQRLTIKESYPSIEEETQYWLAKVYIKAQNESKALETLNGMLNRFSSAKISRGYFLSRVWYELGSLQLKKNDFRTAISSFDKADETGKAGILNTDDQLALWILKSDCHRGLGDYDNAIRILTQVTHENVISGLRLKAMYLRSELYALQNRPELERNQLKALAKKGGEWALKARQTLEEKYGY